MDVDDSIKQHFEQQIATAERLGCEGIPVSRWARFILTHSRPFAADNRTFDVKRAKAKECFSNAAR
jgi:hypothetical protein